MKTKKKVDGHKLMFLHFVAQRHLWFNNVALKKYGVFYSSDSIEDEYWNYFVPENVFMVIRNFDNIKKELSKNKRKSCICLPDFLKNHELLKDEIIEEGYTCASTESWLVYDNNKPIVIEPMEDVEVIISKDEKTKKDFLEVFIDGYGGAVTSDSPYGELDKSYVRSLEKSYYEENQVNFILYYQKVPASVCVLSLVNGYGAYYGGATKEKYRGKGFNTYILKHLIIQAHKVG